MATIIQKQNVIRNATKRMEAHYAAMPADEKGPIDHYCLFWSWYVLDELRKINIKACLQGGSAFWRRIKQSEDDGIDPSVDWGYKFELSTATVNAIASNLLPEMHVWVAIPSQNTIIDLLTPIFKKRCLLEFPWTAPDPPEYLWHTVLELERLREHQVFFYEPDLQATQLAYLYIKEMMAQKLLK